MMSNSLIALRRWDVPLAVTLTLALQMGISTINASTPVLAPAIAADRGWNVTLIALYPIAVYGTAFFFSFHIPALLSRIGGMGLGLVSLATSAIGILFLLSTSPLFMFVAVLLLGFAVGAMNPASAQILGPRISSRNAGLIMSIKSTGIPLGVMLAGAVVPALISWSSWQSAVLDLAAVATVMSVALLPSVRWLNQRDVRGPAAKTQRMLDPISRLASIPGMTRFLVAASIFAATRDCLRTFYVVYLVDHAGLTLLVAGLALSASQAAGVLGQILWATASDRLLSTSTTMVVVGTLIALGIALTASITTDWSLIWIVAVAALYGISAGGFFPLVLAEIARRSADGDAGQLTAAAQIFMIPITLVGPLMFGVVASAISFPAAFAVLAGCTLTATFIVGCGK
jgi:MFS family permease